MISRYSNHAKPRTEAEILREHNSSFIECFQDRLMANPPLLTSEDGQLLFALSQGPVPSLMTYQANDINGYTFYTEAKDENSDYRNSGVTMESLLPVDGRGSRQSLCVVNNQPVGNPKRKV
jgi:hypothetical protein